tara:strand:- start:138 stop:323 length:186 start_codon:yes stop_codon:yes gene_type:complete
MRRTLTNPKKLNKLFKTASDEEIRVEMPLSFNVVIDLRGSRGEEKDRKQMQMYADENGGIW